MFPPDASDSPRPEKLVLRQDGQVEPNLAIQAALQAQLGASCAAAERILGPSSPSKPHSKRNLALPTGDQEQLGLHLALQTDLQGLHNPQKVSYCRSKSRFGLFAVQVLLDCCFAALRASWASLFGCTWTLLGSIWALLAASWAQLGASWAQLGASWVPLGLNLAALGRILSSTWPLSSDSVRLLGLLRLQVAS